MFDQVENSVRGDSSTPVKEKISFVRMAKECYCLQAACYCQRQQKRHKRASVRCAHHSRLYIRKMSTFFDCHLESNASY